MIITPHSSFKTGKRPNPPLVSLRESISFKKEDGEEPFQKKKHAQCTKFQNFNTQTISLPNPWKCLIVLGTVMPANFETAINFKSFPSII